MAATVTSAAPTMPADSRGPDVSLCRVTTDSTAELRPSERVVSPSEGGAAAAHSIVNGMADEAQEATEPITKAQSEEAIIISPSPGEELGWDELQETSRPCTSSASGCYQRPRVWENAPSSRAHSRQQQRANRREGALNSPGGLVGGGGVLSARDCVRAVNELAQLRQYREDQRGDAIVPRLQEQMLVRHGRLRAHGHDQRSMHTDVRRLTRLCTAYVPTSPKGRPALVAPTSRPSTSRASRNGGSAWGNWQMPSIN